MEPAIAVELIPFPVTSDKAEIKASVAMKRILAATLTVTALLLTAKSQAGGYISLTNSDASGTNSFNTGLNWTNGLAPAKGNAYYTTNYTLRTPATAGNYTFAGDSLSLDSGGGMNLKAAGIITITNFILNGGTLANGFGTGAIIAGKITNNGSSSKIDVQGFGRTTTINSPISGTGTITEVNGTGGSGAGTNGYVFLSASNAFSGQWLINDASNSAAGAPILNLTNTSALANGTLLLFTTNINSLQFSPTISTFTLGGLTGTGGFALTNTGGGNITLQVGNNNASTNYSGVMSGGGGLTMIGSGTQTLAGTNTYTGATTVNGGTLALTGSGAVATNSAITLNGGTLDMGSQNATNFTGNNGINFGANGGTLNGNGTEYMFGVSGAYTAFTVAANASAVINENLNITNTANSGYFNLVNAGSGGMLTINGVLTALNNPSGLFLTGGGALTLNNAANNFNTIIYNSGTLITTNFATLGSYPYLAQIGQGVANGPCTFNYGGPAASTTRSIIGNAALINVNNNGSGLVTFTASPVNNRYGGAQTGSGQQLVFGGTSDMALTGVLQDNTPGTFVTGVVKTNSNTLTLYADNTYNGATTIRAGALVGVSGGSCSNSVITLGATTGNQAVWGVSVLSQTQPWTCAGLTVGNNGGTNVLDFNYGYNLPSASLSPLMVSGTAAFTARPAVTVEMGHLVASPGAQYPLMTWTSQTGNVPTNVAVAVAGLWVAAHLTVSGNTLYLVIDSLVDIPAGVASLPPLVFTNVQDYGFMFWSNGPSSGYYGIRTSRYGMVFNSSSLAPSILIPLSNNVAEASALTESWSASFPPASPAVIFSCKVIAGTSTNVVTPLSSKARDAALIESGKFFQRRWHKVMAGSAPIDTNYSTTASGFEISAWPDRIAFVLHLVPTNTVSSATLQMTLDLTNIYNTLVTSGAARALVATNGSGFVFLPSAGTSAMNVDATNALVTVTTSVVNWQSGQEATVGLIIYPAASNATNVLAAAAAVETAPLPLAATPVLPGGSNLAVNYDLDRGWYDVTLPAAGTSGDDGMLRTQFTVTNNTANPQVVRINFDGVPFYIPGITAVLRDLNGSPLGIPVQLSKDWDTTSTNPVFAGNWFHGLTMLTVPANTNLSFDLTMVGQNWGGVPAATHSQLCELQNSSASTTGQQWDESALGSCGETFTYDPEHQLTDNDGADSRPILLLNTNGQAGQWCGNFGGAEFLRYYDSGGTQRRHSRMRTQYARYCPNLTEVMYAGQSDDGKIALSYSASLRRSDDYSRGYHQVSINVVSNVSFSRLVFFQVPADTYAYNNGTNLAYGDIDHTNATRTWYATGGLNKNVGTAVALTNNQPWVSIASSGQESAYRPAAKGYVIRSWNARINGVTNVPPYLIEHSLGNSTSTPGSSLDLVPPPGVTTLQPGDYVQAVIERFYVPESPGDYYGPDQNLDQAVTNYGNTYAMAVREAIGNNLVVNMQAGTLIQTLPSIKIALNSEFAQFAITGGLNYGPVTFMGASTYQYPSIEELVGTNWIMINQSVNGNDFWQADFNGTNRSWDITFNLKLGSTNYQDVSALQSSPVTRTFRFRNPNSIVPVATTLGLNTSPASPSIYGQAVVFTATVQTNGTAAAAATGNVVFTVSGIAVATNVMANATALCTNNALNAGTYPIQAVYSGDSYYLPSTNTVTQVVTPANTTVSYIGTNFTYNGLAQGPSIMIVGSSGTRTTNYFSTLGTLYGSVNAPTNGGSYYVTNTVAADSNYLGANTSFVFTITTPIPILFTNAVWLASGGGFHLGGSGPAGQSWRLFTATNLALPGAQWTLETSNTFPGNGQFNYTSPVPTNALQQFYRMVSP